MRSGIAYLEFWFGLPSFKCFSSLNGTSISVTSVSARRWFIGNGLETDFLVLVCKLNKTKTKNNKAMPNWFLGLSIRSIVWKENWNKSKNNIYALALSAKFAKSKKKKKKKDKHCAPAISADNRHFFFFFYLMFHFVRIAWNSDTKTLSYSSRKLDIKCFNIFCAESLKVINAYLNLNTHDEILIVLSNLR